MGWRREIRWLTQKVKGYWKILASCHKESCVHCYFVLCMMGEKVVINHSEADAGSIVKKVATVVKLKLMKEELTGAGGHKHGQELLGSSKWALWVWIRGWRCYIMQIGNAALLRLICFFVSPLLVCMLLNVWRFMVLKSLDDAVLCVIADWIF